MAVKTAADNSSIAAMIAASNTGLPDMKLQPAACSRQQAGHVLLAGHTVLCVVR